MLPHGVFQDEASGTMIILSLEHFGMAIHPQEISSKPYMEVVTKELPTHRIDPDEMVVNAT